MLTCHVLTEKIVILRGLKPVIDKNKHNKLLI